MQVILFAILLSVSSFAGNYLGVMGAGGEPRGERTIFDPDLAGVASFVSQAGSSWQVRAALNGGHANTEAIARQISPDQTPFTQESFNAMIENYREGIRSGRIRSGDQLLLYIGSHGGGREGNEESHSISLGNGNGESQSGRSSLTGPLVSLDRLRPLIDEARARGVRLGILDFSCHSGASQALADDNTCVITSTGPDHLAWSQGFGMQFSQQMRPGRSLEDVFRDSIARSEDQAFPMISSPAGRSIADELYPLITPFLYDYVPRATYQDKLLPFLRGQAEANQCDLAEAQFNQLMTLVNQVMPVVEAAPLAPGKTPPPTIQSSLQEYFRIQNDIRRSLAALGPGTLREQVVICEREATNCSSLSVEEILNFDVPRVRASLEAQLNNPSKAETYRNQLNRLPAVEATRTRLLQERPELRQYQTYLDRVAELEQRSASLSGTISRNLRQLYQRLYDERVSSPGPNPCRDFRL